MEKIPALTLSFLITMLIVGNYLFFTVSEPIREPVTIVRVLDGDTVELADGRTVRLANINTPEKKTAYASLAKTYLEQFINTEVYLEPLGTDKYSRTLGRLFYKNTYLNKEIVAQGMAHHYIVFKGEEEVFSAAQEEALAKGEGMWERSDSWGCLDVEINKYDEYLHITDSCNLTIEGWTVKDESTKTYTFKRSMGSPFILYSAKGTDTNQAVYWGKESVWNDESDSVFIRDRNGKLVHYQQY